MINFSKIKSDGFLGKSLRFILKKAMPKGAILPIIQGPLKGCRWIVDSSDFGCWLGSYEFPKQKAFASFVREGDVVYDLGANVGFYSLLVARLAGKTGTIFSFEPFPRNIFYINRHIALNNIKNIKIIEAAVASKNGEGFFTSSESPSAGMISRQESDIKIKIISLDSMLEGGHVLPPDVIKMDIEGAEYEALLGGEGLLKKYMPVIIFATHSPELRISCINFLKGIGYSVEAISPNADVNKEDEFIAVRK